MALMVLFDFDGTLADTADDMLCALNLVLGERGLALLARGEVVGCVSGGARALLRRGGVGEDEVEDARVDFLRYYEETGYGRTRLLPGVDEMLHTLNDDGIPWGVVTNKPRRYYEPIAAAMDLVGRGAAVMLCGDDLARAKPFPDGLLFAADKVGVDAGRCCYVGDDWRDAAAANNAGMAFVGALWGYFVMDESWRGRRVFALASVPSLVPRLVRGWARGLARG